MHFYEHFSEELIGASDFFWRVAGNCLKAALLFAATIVVGVLGFRFIGHLGWMDSLVDSTMLMSGMGPVNCQAIHSNVGKLFASFYALFCGIVFVAAMGIVLAPVLHRMMHATFQRRRSSVRRH